VSRFFLDENLSVHVASLLRTLGHEVTTARDEGLIRAHDDEQLFFAAENGLILVSHDGDFYVLHRGIRRWLHSRGETAIHSGILIIPDNLSTEQKARLLDIFAASGLVAANELYEWFPDRDWVRCP
jgi:predicted nuclease of predicted toxin-antitoxin system